MSLRVALGELARLDKSDLDTALRRIFTVDARMLRVARVSYWELSPDHAALHCRLLFESATGTFTSGGELHAADFPRYFEAMLGSRAIVANDVFADPRTAELGSYFSRHDIHAMIGVPVWRRGKLAGVVCHEHVGQPRAWGLDEQDFVLGIGNMVSVAVEAVDRRRAEEGYALFARTTNDVLWDWNVTSDIITYSDALHRVFRYRPEDVGASVDWWLDRVHPNDRPVLEDKLDEILAGTRDSWDEQYRWRRADGTDATVIDRGLVIHDEAGAPVRMVGSMLDISDRVELQRRLALSDRMASFGSLAAGVAHEINNPLTYINANIATALEDLAEGRCVPAELVDLLRDAQEGAERVRRIVRDLSVFSRPRDDAKETIDVRPIIESSINMAWNEIRHRAQLEKELHAIPHVSINGGRLGQVVLNILINAAQAIPEGNVDLNRIVVRTCTDADGTAVIEIRDTGPGIPAEVYPRIFEPFFTTKPVGSGTGLGLAICHSIVTMAGGRIDVTSPTVGGCIVRVVLPPASSAVAATRPPAAFVGPRRRVLLVEDEAPVRRTLRRLLEQRHEVTVADGGECALEHLASGAEFDVILCDVMMPRMTGMDLHARLVADNSPFVTRLIFMTGGAFSARSRDFLATCDRPVLEKPVDKDMLHRAIATLAR